MQTGNERLKVTTNDVDGQDSSLNLIMAQKLAENKRRRCNYSNNYNNCSFIMSSVAEVERLWFVARNIVSNNRKSMSPVLFESLIFLKVNIKYWDIHTVSEEIKMARSAAVTDSINLDGRNSVHEQ